MMYMIWVNKAMNNLLGVSRTWAPGSIVRGDCTIAWKTRSTGYYGYDGLIRQWTICDGLVRWETICYVFMKCLDRICQNREEELIGCVKQWTNKRVTGRDNIWSSGCVKRWCVKGCVRVCVNRWCVRKCPLTEGDYYQGRVVRAITPCWPCTITRNSLIERGPRNLLVYGI